MTAQARKPAKPAAVRIRRPKPGSKAEAILTLATTTPAIPVRIAEKLNTSPQNVYQVLERYGIEQNTLETYKKTRADIYAAAQLKILSAVGMDDLKVESARDVKDALTGLGILVDKERLERGQATSRIEVDLSARLRAALSRSGQREISPADIVDTDSTVQSVDRLLPNDLPNADGE